MVVGRTVAFLLLTCFNGLYASRSGLDYSAASIGAAGAGPGIDDSFKFLEYNLLQESAGKIAFPWLFTFDYKSLNMTGEDFENIRAAITVAYKTQWNAPEIFAREGEDNPEKPNKPDGWPAMVPGTTIDRAFDCWRKLPICLSECKEGFENVTNVVDRKTVKIGNRSYIYEIEYDAKEVLDDDNAAPHRKFTSVLGVVKNVLNDSAKALKVIEKVHEKIPLYSYKNREKKLVAFIKESEPDVGVLPELESTPAMNGLIVSLKGLGWEVAHFPRNPDQKTKARGRKSRNGVGILWKPSVWYKLKEEKNFLGDQTGTKTDDLTGSAGLVVLQHKQNSGVTLNIVAVHLTTKSKDREGKKRSKELVDIKKFVEEQSNMGKYTIFSGDFNVDLLGKRNRPEEHLLKGKFGGDLNMLTGYHAEDDSVLEGYQPEGMSLLEGSSLSELACPNNPDGSPSSVTGACFQWCLHTGPKNETCSHQNMIDAFKTNKKDADPGCTSKTDDREALIDLVWSSENLNIEEVSRQPCPDAPIPNEEHGSDHIPIMVTFKAREERPAKSVPAPQRSSAMQVPLAGIATVLALLLAVLPVGV